MKDIISKINEASSKKEKIKPNEFYIMFKDDYYYFTKGLDIETEIKNGAVGPKGGPFKKIDDTLCKQLIRLTDLHNGVYYDNDYLKPKLYK